ncbi:MAG: SOS response-associated peptidase, partial [Gammaproteobacteria bacterium]|nr:SOS response-associated peptidase [Gammaproteobacteria bacterium]
LMPIHDKASPLMLSAEDNSLQRWLDCEANPVETLTDLLEPTIRHRFTVTPINKPSLYQPVGESFSMEPDEQLIPTLMPVYLLAIKKPA